MGEIINLNQYRKKREKAEKAERAAKNRASHGLSKEDRANARRKVEQRQADLDTKRLESGPSDDPPKVG